MAYIRAVMSSTTDSSEPINILATCSTIDKQTRRSTTYNSASDYHTLDYYKNTSRLYHTSG